MSGTKTQMVLVSGYIVKSIVENSGGKIRFESPRENHGTTFYVTLPIKGLIKKKK